MLCFSIWNQHIILHNKDKKTTLTNSGSGDMQGGMGLNNDSISSQDTGELAGSIIDPSVLHSLNNLLFLLGVSAFFLVFLD